MIYGSQYFYGKRTLFTGALTHGSLWPFFTAYDGGIQIRIYSSGIFAADKLLEDMLSFCMILGDSNMSDRSILHLAQIPRFGKQGANLVLRTWN